ncbi:MAG TPA: hypothetical protein VKB84_08580 [Candidatus Binataceae bacterium]|jgi:hypothetical protein|nr:hypothetical protein [Candidatus Binataceae bacterium]
MIRKTGLDSQGIMLDENIWNVVTFIPFRALLGKGHSFLHC